MRNYLPLHILPIEEKGCHILVRARVNDQPANLLIDTGASHTVFDKTRASRYSFKASGEENRFRALGLGNTIESHILELEKFSIENKHYRDYPVILMDLSPINDLYEGIVGEEIHGILGSDLLLGLEGVINYKKQKIRLNGKKTPFMLLSMSGEILHIMMKIKIQGKEANLLIDTGASTTLFNSRNFASLQVYQPEDLQPNEQASAGIEADYSGHNSLVIDHIDLGGLRLSPFEALLLDLSHVNALYAKLGLPPIDGLLGSDILFPHKAVINYRKKYLRLSYNRQ